MKYYIEEEAHAVRKAFESEVLAWPTVTSRLMFGCPSYSADGKLFAFLVTEGVVLTQLRLRDRETVAEIYETGPFEAGERVMDLWLKVHIDKPAQLARLMPFVKRSYETALKRG